MDFSKILAHPDKDEIISKLVNGVKTKDVSDWLKLKYPNNDQAHLKLSSKMLKEFVDNNLDLYNTLKNDVADVKAGNKQDKKIAESLLNNKTYKERLNQLADDDIDIKRIMNEVIFLIRERIEQYFDKVQENPGNLKPDYGLIKWFEVLLNATEKFDKIVNKAPDQVIQHNITMQAMDQHTAIFQDVIREVLAELDSEAAFLFMDKIREKLEKLSPPEAEKPFTQEKRLAEAKILMTQAESIKNEMEGEIGSDDE
jgi:hypothetical protein